jgi:hypothetical protein
MTDLPLHPLIVHVPLGLAAVMPFIAAGVGLAIWRGRLPRAAWSVVVGLQAVVLVASLFAQRTGEQDEDGVKKRVGKDAVHHHEELAERFTWGAGTSAVLAAAALVVRAHPASHGLMAATTVATCVTTGLGVLAGHAGGTIVHGAGGLTGVPRDGG